MAELRALAPAAERLARAQRALALARARAGEARAGRDAARQADLRRRRDLMRWLPPAWPWLPGAGRAADAHARAAAGRARAAAAERARADRLDRLARRAALLRERLPRAGRLALTLGTPPESVAAALERVARSVEDLRAGSDRAGDEAWAESAAACAEGFVEAVRRWARLHDEASAREAAAAAAAARPARAARGRAYLPIPRTLWAAAERGGALRDPGAPAWASPWFVRPGVDPAPLRNLLPLGARRGGAGLAFPPIPFRASGQNLWSLFDAESWGHVRRQSYATAGGRCMVCGGRSDGFLAESLYDEAERAHPIECHEVWEWHAHPRHDDIGIQILRQLLVVCRNCHPMFHEGYFLERARKAGIEPEVAAAIRKRRMAMNHVSGPELDAALKAEAARHAAVSGVDRWVVDLTHLAGQTYMTSRVMTLQSGNRSGTPPEQIAGIAFETQDGRAYPAASVVQACRALLADRAPAPRGLAR